MFAHPSTKSQISGRHLIWLFPIRKIADYFRWPMGAKFLPDKNAFLRGDGVKAERAVASRRWHELPDREEGRAAFCLCDRHGGARSPERFAPSRPHRAISSCPAVFRTWRASENRDG